MKSTRPSSILLALSYCSTLLSCSQTETRQPEESETSEPSRASEGDAGADAGLEQKGRLIVVTERESPETSLQYLHILEDWPDNGELNYDDAIELGAFVNPHVLGNSVFVHQPEDGTVRKIRVGADGSVAEDETISFANFGAAGYAGDIVYASPTRAYLLDEGAGILVAWDPEAMVIEGSTDLDEDTLTRDGHAAQVSRGVVLDGYGYVSASYRDWETLEYYDVAGLGVFDATSDEPKLEIIEDDRCASSVTTPFDGGDGYVYLVSDAALGFDAIANPNETEKKLCVLRIEPGSKTFDPDFLVDLGEILDSPGFYAAHPMAEGKLLVNVWASDVDVADVATADDPSWYWSYPPYFEYSIVDLATGQAKLVEGIPRAAVQWSLTLRVDDQTYVQTYGEDASSQLHRVDPDGTVKRVLSNDAGVDVQFIGRLTR